MGFSQLKQDYKFLGDILNLYDELDQHLVEDEQYQGIYRSCDRSSLLQDDHTGNYKKFCKKLSINLLQLAERNYTGYKFIKYCDIFYIWMYFETNKYSIPNEITKSLYDASTQLVTSIRKKIPCPYFNFNENIHEPKKLMNLRIFNNNVDTIQSKLKGAIESDECSLKRYVYKCIKIYRDMHSTYCSNGDKKEGNQNSCEIIDMFNTLYSSYINKRNGILHEFPELSSNTPLDVIDGCPLEQRQSDSFPDETQGTPITRGVSTALSSMVGIPPFLILMYKFTPIRNLFRFGNKNNTIITSNFDKNMENELFHAIKEDSNIKDIQPKYNIGYEPK
ncbi:PIR protein [Plasmodium vivax]|uniref:VIR protein n=1 Tax=Plasmodium vivax TaxID=5855 RepID=A0A565A3Q4_PLAVI|nr:PIR protein [Plasmodium vivax]